MVKVKLKEHCTHKNKEAFHTFLCHHLFISENIQINKLSMFEILKKKPAMSLNANNNTILRYTYNIPDVIIINYRNVH
jgi:hypothetical protein